MWDKYEAVHLYTKTPPRLCFTAMCNHLLYQSPASPRMGQFDIKLGLDLLVAWPTLGQPEYWIAGSRSREEHPRDHIAGSTNTQPTLYRPQQVRAGPTPPHNMPTNEFSSCCMRTGPRLPRLIKTGL